LVVSLVIATITCGDQVLGGLLARAKGTNRIDAAYNGGKLFRRYSEPCRDAPNLVGELITSRSPAQRDPHQRLGRALELRRNAGCGALLDLAVGCDNRSEGPRMI
jgi:hypothetical protein